MTDPTQKSKGVKSVATPVKKSKLRFFGEVVEELKKAHWPTRQEALRLSLLVLVVCAIVGGILGGLDYGFTKLLATLLLGG
jgi:preprotein translocase subunit SecE